MKNFSVTFWRRMFVIFATVLAVIVGVFDLAHSQAAALNAALKTKTYKTVKGENSANEDTEYFKMEHKDADDLKAYLDETCRKLEAEGAVLLRNDNYVLPLEKGSKVSLFGQGSVNINYSSTGSSATTAADKNPTLRDGLSQLEVNETLWDFYSTGAAAKYRRNQSNFIYKINEAPWELYAGNVMNSFANYGDAAIYVVSRDSGEGRDVTTMGSDGRNGSYLSLSEEERGVLKGLTELKKSGTFKSIIVLLNSAVPIQLDFMFEEDISIDAALWIGNVGSTGVYAIGDLLVGDAVPSGRLSDTYLKDNFSSPAMASWAANPNKSFAQTYANAGSYPQFDETQNVYGVYVEGIYVGYRYYETRYADVVTERAKTGEYDYDKDVAFPFGYGLSYSEFQYSDFALAEDEDSFTVSVKVSNIGGYAGKEVVQVYLQKPYTQYDIEHKVEKSAIELVGFGKTGELGSGDEEVVTVKVSKELLKSYDAYGAGTYILDDGDYYFSVGANAHAALDNILAAQGYTVEGYPDATLCDKWNNPALDTETYAYSAENPTNRIVNRFDFSDINRYEGRGSNAVTYVSRSDWEGTFPKGGVTLSITEQMAKDIASYKELVEDGSEMPTYGANNGLTLMMLRSTEENPIPYDSPVWEDLLDQLSFGDQAYLITNGQHTTVALESVGKPATRDENGPNGVSGSTTNISLPSEGIWASTFNTELMRRAGDALAEDAVAAGVTGLYAPGVNLHRTPFGGRAHEYFSEDPFLMAISCVEEVKGMQAKGVIAYVKHFAVNDEETNRNGIGIWLCEQEMRELVLLPFEYAFRPSIGNAHATMTSFNRVGCIWTSASSALMERVLRDEWAFDGFSVTDMAASNAQSFMTFVDGIANGTNCYDGPGSEAALNDYRQSAMFAGKMRESAHRILYVTANYSAITNGISSSDRIVTVMTWWEIVVLVLVIAAAALAAASGAMLAVSYARYYKAEKKRELQDGETDQNKDEITQKNS